MKRIAFFLLSVLTLSFPLAAQNYDIYVSDAGNFNNPPWQILKFDQSGQNPSVFINSQLNWPQDILFPEDSAFVLISNLGSGTINRHDANTGAFLSAFASQISGPTRMKIGADSLLYVLQWSGNGRVLRFDLNGTFIGDFTSVGVPQSIGMDWDAAGNLYVSSYSGDLVRKFSPSGADLGVFVNTNLLGPTNIWFDAGGDLLVSDYNGTAVKRYDSTGTFQGDFLTGLSNSEGIAFLPGGDILVGNGATKSVKQFTASGTFVKDLIASGAGNLLTPNAVVLRESSPTGMEEEIREARPFLLPSRGRNFEVREELRSKLNAVEVFDLFGRKVGGFSGFSWNSEGLPAGLYLVRLELRSGETFAERIILR